MRRLILGTGLALMWLLASPVAASADPPGPTNYQSEIIAIEPATEGFEIEVVGGDSFVLLTVDRGVSVEVIGYSGEPYLRFRADGIVEENAAAPSKYINEDRYGRADIPTGVDAAAEPDWRIVAEDGNYAWHDHRTHWMNPVAPPGRGPGDRVAEGVVPLLVDGAEVDVTVVSVWQPGPAVFPSFLGLVAGAGLGMLVLARRRWAPSVTVALAAVALTVGLAAYWSVPGETQPPWSLFVFPLVSLLVALAVLDGSRVGGLGPILARHRSTLLVLAALELVAWGLLHWSWLWRAILPTSLPFWLDRLGAATVLTGAAGVAVAALIGAATQPIEDRNATAGGVK